MSEQPADEINNNEAVNTDTLSIKAQREQAAKELGISYEDSLKMSKAELQQKVVEKNDPHFAIKQQLLEANNKIAEMQNEPEVTSETPTLLAEDAPTEIASAPAISNVIELPVANESADKESKKLKPRVKQLAVAALVAVTAFATIGAANKANDTQKVSTGENADTANADSQNKQTPDNIFDLIKFNPQGFNEKDYNRSEQHVRDRMSTEGAFDGEKRNVAELDAHVLAKVKNNPSLMAAVLEVRESGNKEGIFSLSDVNNDTRKFSVRGENGEYSTKGEKAVDTLESSWDRGSQGKLLSNSKVSKIMDKYEFINHGTDSGKFKNALDNKTYSAGVFDYRPDLGDRVYEKELGNGEIVYFKVNEKDATRDCLNIQTLRLKGDITTTPGIPGTPGTPTPPENTPPTTDTPPEKPPVDDDKKPWEVAPGHDNGNHPAGKPEPTTDQDLGGNTPGGNPNEAPAPTTPRPETPPAPEPGTGNGTEPTGPAH